MNNSESYKKLCDMNDKMHGIASFVSEKTKLFHKTIKVLNDAKIPLY